MQNCHLPTSLLEVGCAEVSRTVGGIRGLITKAYLTLLWGYIGVISPYSPLRTDELSENSEACVLPSMQGPLKHTCSKTVEGMR